MELLCFGHLQVSSTNPWAYVQEQTCLQYGSQLTANAVCGSGGKQVWSLQWTKPELLWQHNVQTHILP